MDQQLTEEEKPKISRSKARHLRRKRLADARRIAENRSISTQFYVEQNPSFQESDNTLSKSKARRLRKKKKVESIKGSGQVLRAESRVLHSNNQTEILVSSQSLTNISGYDKSDQKFCELQSDGEERSESAHFLASLTELENANTDPEYVCPIKHREKDTLLTYQQSSSSNTTSNNKKLGEVQNERDSPSSNDSFVYGADLITSLSHYDHQIQKNSVSVVLTQGTLIDADSISDIKLNQSRDSCDSLSETESYNISFENDLNLELLNSNKSSNKSQILFCDQIVDFGISSSFKILNLESNQSSANTEVVQEKDDIESQHKKENQDTLKDALHRTTTPSLLKTYVTSDDDLHSLSSNSTPNFIDQHEINTIQTHDTLGLETRIVKPALNSTELIENKKNLKISSGSSNSHTAFQPNASVIDLTAYSSSDLIINTDSTYNLEEQQLMIDFISDSNSDLVQNTKLFQTSPLETLSKESQNKDKTRERSVTKNLLALENQTSFDIIKDYSLPSTSVEDSVLPLLGNSQNSVTYKTVEHSNRGHDFSQSEEKMSSSEKNREQIKAEREAKKAAKALAKNKVKVLKSEEKTDPKNSKDVPIKASGSELVKKDITSNVAEKKPVPSQKKVVPMETEIVARTDNDENESQSKVDGKSKKETRAERRAKQEAQRAAKEKLAAEKNKPKSAVPSEVKLSSKISDHVKTAVKKSFVENNLHEVKLFKHLYHERELSLVKSPTLNSTIHSAILRLGVQYANKVIIGSNARCVALLAAIKQLVKDFERPSQADFTRGLEASLQECAAYLHHCRPMAVSMQNALKHLKWQMTQLPTSMSDDEAKSKLEDAIDTYIREQILLAGKAISNTIQTKISNGDVILTYAFSSLIHNILIDAHVAGKQFRVIVVDGRPWLEGKEQLRRLAKYGIQCSYILINALSFIMPEVSKVFLGAHAILANGAVMSRAGTAQVALMAKTFNVPVLVACETHKSCERVQTDSFVYNEIGDANELVRNSFSNSKKSLLSNWKTKKSLDLLNITFDVTPADLVSAVVTELAILPCTSIPVILRIKPSEI